MQEINKKVLKIKHKIINFFKNLNPKIVLTNYVIFFIVFAVMLTIDLVTKHVFYKGDPSINQNYGGVIGIRNILHEGTTFFGEKLSYGLLHSFTFIVFFICLAVVLSIKQRFNIPIIVGLAFVSAGAFGNMIDRMAFKGVRDIFFLPWYDKGVWNFADFCLASGSIFTALYVVVINVIVWCKEKQKQKNANRDTQELVFEHSHHDDHDDDDHEHGE
ncbi:signal peptidase II [[Mycoplasma] gypis]|uniref:Signal peptidase II n=1 Tax=[Mycoplasma] gypis TaxID=92404 RepID=A0ABZ2RNS9_9BACT|nr:signal peptidase II [[Mycoplasma] gypis]MBN0919272.1 signal peptidase II [[Mycoplasma] gypis]